MAVGAFRPTIAIIAVVGLLGGTLAWAGDAPAPVPAFKVVDGDTLWTAPPLLILGSRVPVALPGVVRSVSIIGRDELEQAPARSVGEILQTVPGVVVGHRQPFGVQADLTVRGSTFDQVLVLIDGFEAGDPQTGHHLLDLPFGLADVDRLEVLPGHGSSLYGSGAFGGTVNVVTRRPAERSGGEVVLLGGGNGTWGVRGGLDLVPEGPGERRSRISVDRFMTDGHDEVTSDGSTAWAGNDARSTTATWREADQWGGWELESFAGFADRNFGARDFYAPYPSFESTRTFFAWTRGRNRVAPRFTLEPRLSVRTHRDRFTLFRDRPQVYLNDHLARRFSGELRGLIELGGAYNLALGAEGVYEDIESEGLRNGVAGPALGSHTRRRAAASVEIDRHGERLRWQAGFRVDERQDSAARASGSGAVSWALTHTLTARAGAGSAFRIPTFTDLYYVDPANRGNPDLRPEAGWTWDAGLALDRERWFADAAWFERRETDRIEWARPTTPPADPVWQVLNVAEATVMGVEARAGWRHPRGHTASLGWSWLDTSTELTAGYEGKYTLLAPRRTLTAQSGIRLPHSLRATLFFRYLERTGGPDPFRFQAVADAQLEWVGGGLFAALMATNVLDRRYEEVPGVSLPGRLLTATMGNRF